MSVATQGKLTLGQSPNTVRQINAIKTNQIIKIDGDLSDESWDSAELAGDFLRYWPSDSGLAQLPTEVEVIYSDQFPYVGIKAYHTERELVVQSLKRDANPWYSDGVYIILDPANRNLSPVNKLVHRFIL